MEGLIGKVTFEKSGLATKHNVRFKMTRDAKDIWFYLGRASGEKINLFISASYASSRDLLYYASLVSHQSAASPYGEIWRITSEQNQDLFILYSKKTDNQVDYYVNITSNWVSLRILSIYTEDNTNIIGKEIEAPDIDSLTKIPILNMGGI